MAKKEIWFVYDGECPICRMGARNYVLAAQKTHQLITLDARTHQQHWLMAEIRKRGMDLNDGMVIWDGSEFYHADKALGFMAKSSQNSWIFNILTKRLWRKAWLAKLMYPPMRGCRNLVLKIKGIPLIPHNDENGKAASVFERAFGEAWDVLPVVMKKHYLHPSIEQKANVVNGHLNVSCKPWLRLFYRLFKSLGSVPLIEQKNVPVRVRFSGGASYFLMQREFNFSGMAPFLFRSSMYATRDGDIIEKMKFGVHWRSRFKLEGDRVLIEHQAFEWRCAALTLRLPLEIILGKAVAEEWALDNNRFGMFVRLEHRLFGRIYEYEGIFAYSQDYVK